jgi:hypothetical protein
MRSIFICIAISALFISGCDTTVNNKAKTNDTIPKDTLSVKDAIKKTLQEDLPPPTDIKQFNWFYSAFAHAATTGNDTMFDVVINPVYGLWIIHSEGAVPNYTHVNHILEFKKANGKGILPFDRDAMMSVPKEEALPVVDCESKDLYNKKGCFTSLQNSFYQQKTWKHASLPPEKDRAIEASAATITRTVINTENYRFYFSLIDGSWYLTFLDIMRPCEA